MLPACLHIYYVSHTVRCNPPVIVGCWRCFAAPSVTELDPATKHTASLSFPVRASSGAAPARLNSQATRHGASLCLGRYIVNERTTEQDALPAVERSRVRKWCRFAPMGTSGTVPPFYPAALGCALHSQSEKETRVGSSLTGKTKKARRRQPAQVRATSILRAPPRATELEESQLWTCSGTNLFIISGCGGMVC